MNRQRLNVPLALDEHTIFAQRDTVFVEFAELKGVRPPAVGARVHVSGHATPSLLCVSVPNVHAQLDHRAVDPNAWQHLRLLDLFERPVGPQRVVVEHARRFGVFAQP